MGGSGIIEEIPLAEKHMDNYRLSVLREDLSHLYEDLGPAELSGNKWRKLKYNIAYAKNQGFKRIITFGGAYSNHIAATAAAGNAYGLETLGIIRGEPFDQLNPTLQLAKDRGMELAYMSRERYRIKDLPAQKLWLEETFGPGFYIPEGGSNAFGVQGCKEMMDEISDNFDVIVTAVGTGATLAGIVNALDKNQHAIGMSALKGAYDLTEQIQDWIDTPGKSWELNHDYHFGGYAKVTPELIHFINEFKKRYLIQLDPVYTGKMVYGVLDLIEKGSIMKGSSILMVHTGGIQGIAGMNMKLKRKGMNMIEL